MSNTNKVVIGQIASELGHNDFTGSISEAVKTIIDSVKSSKMWAFINNEPYFFTGKDEEDEAAIEELLDASDAPSFTLTGQLVGGSK